MSSTVYLTSAEHAALLAEIERLQAALAKIADPSIPWGHMKLIAREALEQGGHQNETQS